MTTTLKVRVGIRRAGARPWAGEERGLAAVQKGFESIGAEILYDDDPEFADICVSWGMRKNAKLQNHPLESAARHLIADNAFIDRANWISLQWDYIAGYAAPHVPIAGRGELCPVPMKPWKEGPVNRVLLLGQTKQDASLLGVQGRARCWLSGVGARYEAAGKEVKFRRHPSRMAQQFSSYPHVGGSLEDALDWADLAVAYSSTSLVDAALAGVPVAPGNHMAMVWPLRTSLDPAAIPSPKKRDRWLDWIMSQQFRFDEIETGEFWDIMQPGF